MNDSEISLAPPRGMRDFYPAEMALRNCIFDAWRKAAEMHGFNQYDACVVESLDLLKRKAGEEIADQIYTFQDKSGRDLALRPEMTPSLARMIVARQGSLAIPIKWYAIAQCFRYERMSRGRKREHYQWNLDVVGEESVLAEVEIISAATAALEILGLSKSQYTIRFNSRALLAELLEKSGIPSDFHPAVFLALDKKAKIPESEIVSMLNQSGLDNACIKKAFDLLSIKTIEDASGYLEGASSALTSLKNFINTALASGLDRETLVFDISVVRGLAYYTGIVFEAFDKQGKFRAIFGGGRYDNLLSDIGGKPMTAVGLGFGDVVIAELIQDLNITPKLSANEIIAIGFMEDEQARDAVRLASEMRRNGFRTDLGLKPEKAKSFFSRITKNPLFTGAVFLGPDDISRGSAKLKNLKTRAEELIPLPQDQSII